MSNVSLDFISQAKAILERIVRAELEALVQAGCEEITWMNPP